MARSTYVQTNERRSADKRFSVSRNYAGAVCALRWKNTIQVHLDDAFSEIPRYGFVGFQSVDKF